ncbi:MAG: hypothetical protein ACRDA3_00950 [Peptostreptococcaceae bacterium]
MKIKKSIASTLFILSIVSLLYMEIKDILYLFDGHWSIEKEQQKQKMVEEGLTDEEIRQNLKDKNYNKEDYVRG